MSNHDPHQAPCACSEEELTRRNFLKGMFVAMGGFITLSFSWPFIQFLIPSGAKKGADFIKIPNFKDVPLNTPTKMHMDYIEVQAFMKKKVYQELWVVKRSDSEALVYSPLCPHLGCHYGADKEKFLCPCHNSIFAMDGKVLGGPSPRGLDVLPIKIDGGELYVQWKMYRPGIAAKVEA